MPNSASIRCEKRKDVAVKKFHTEESNPLTTWSHNATIITYHRGNRLLTVGRGSVVYYMYRLRRHYGAKCTPLRGPRFSHVATTRRPQGSSFRPNPRGKIAAKRLDTRIIASFNRASRDIANSIRRALPTAFVCARTTVVPEVPADWSTPSPLQHRLF